MDDNEGWVDPISVHMNNSAVETQKTVIADLRSNQLLYFGCARQNCKHRSQKRHAWSYKFLLKI